MTVGISGRDIEGVENPTLFDEVARRRRALRQIMEEDRNHMPPRLLLEMEVEGLHGFLRGLMGGKACPFVPLGALRVLRLREVTFSLREPIAGPVGHLRLPSEACSYITAKQRGVGGHVGERFNLEQAIGVYFQTSRATSATNPSFAHCASSDIGAPSSVVPKPHWGLIARCSSGT